MNTDTVKNGSFSVEAPSNIAFVKYWGKKARQYPINPSISMTLKQCVTKCEIDYRYGTGGFALESYQFEGQNNDAFQNRIEAYFNAIRDLCPMLNHVSLSLRTWNSFPHSAGIASSASAFAAIGYALAILEKEMGYCKGEDINTRASFLARLGSGSAARSIIGPYTLWGENDNNNQASNDHAIQVSDSHESFHHVKDCILLIDTAEKKVSSSLGHHLMNDHPFRDSRVTQANKNASDLLKAMREGDWEHFGKIIEEEALTLHAMMMTSSPSFILLSPQSLTVIEHVREFRAQTNLPLYFTIDAGPNIHLIYPQNHAVAIEEFIQDHLSHLCQDGRYIIDECGKGAHVIA